MGQQPKGRCLVVGAGKASASIASALEAYAMTNWPKARLEGVVLTRYGHNSPTNHIKIVEGLVIQCPIRLVWMGLRKSWH
ncbi:DUF4147 domain-containing protein [Polynucleobacter necessarius]|uniref:DUF4147 domain-containing protein n=1 Tax=Polynucleobacter necessarius TaxID=576610 RepID=UPI0022B2588D|nr:DUF4147 domain-containing protein [Polynucleobacter necessarius]